MPEIKLQHILTMVQLLTKGARHNFVEVTTADLGSSLRFISGPSRPSVCPKIAPIMSAFSTIPSTSNFSLT